MLSGYLYEKAEATRLAVLLIGINEPLTYNKGSAAVRALQSIQQIGHPHHFLILHQLHHQLRCQIFVRKTPRIHLKITKIRRLRG